MVPCYTPNFEKIFTVDPQVRDSNLHDLGSQLCQNYPFDPKHIFGRNSCPPPGPFDREASDILKRAVYILT